MSLPLKAEKRKLHSAVKSMKEEFQTMCTQPEKVGLGESSSKTRAGSGCKDRDWIQPC